MLIKFYGTFKNKKVTIKFCREAIKFAANLLMSKRLQKNLEIEVFIRKIDDDDRDTVATCYSLDIEERPKYFELELDKNLGPYKVIRAIMHEMVHVMQRASGVMFDYTRPANQVRYHKKIFNEKKLEYWDWPWEIEAYGREYGLYKRFLAMKAEQKKNDIRNNNSRSVSTMRTRQDITTKV
jgi:hypothetical protein